MFNLKQNYFELFDLPVDFVINNEKLKAKYHQILMKVHPDHYTHASDQEKRLSLQYASLTNEAYEVLSNPVKRALYLLSLKGIEIDLEKNTAMSPEFLLQQMELREAITDLSNNPSQHEALLMRIEQESQLLIEKLTQAFTHQADKQAQQLALQLLFFNKLKQELIH